MPSTDAQKRAQKKYHNKNKEQQNARCTEYYENNCERLKARRMERYYLKKQQKAQEKANLANLEQYPSAN